MNQNDELEVKTADEASEQNTVEAAAAETAEAPVNEEETAAEAAVEAKASEPEQESEEEAPAAEEAVATEEAVANKEAEATEEAEASEAPAAETDDEEKETETDDNTDAAVEPKDQPAKAKKKCPIQMPVLISLGIVLAALIGYFVYSAFFLHDPRGIVWLETKDGINYYYEFSEDNTFRMTYASYEETVGYEKVTENGKDILRLNYPSSTVDLEWSMSGSPILKNQTLTLTHDGEEIWSCEQVDDKVGVLELPTEKPSDPALIGEWVAYGSNQEVRLTFGEDGSMRTENVYHYYGATYSQAFNMTYTVDDGYIQWTFASVVADEETGEAKIHYDVEPDPYLLEGDSLVFMNISFTRAGAEASADEA